MVPAAVFRLVVALFAAPFVRSVGRRVDMPRASAALAVTYASAVAAFAAEVVEHAAPAPGFDAVQHVAYAVAAVAALVTALLAHAEVRRAVGAGR